MDPKNEFELDITMETKCHYKLRSSLKKRKSRNPLGSLDITEVNADTTLAPPLRRVSFAASNYVKPFMDDPEKNTIWDNTYEEEVNHTDSTKSENTNHTNLSEHKSQHQEITNTDVQKECVTNIYCDQDVENMEISCFDQTMINEEERTILGDSNLDITPCILPNIDVKNTELSTFNMELTCNWKNNIIQSNVLIPDEISARKNSTIHQEQDMSMTCCFSNDKIQENKLLHTSSSKIVCGKEELILYKSKKEYKCVYPISMLHRTKKEDVFLPEHSGMDFTCGFSNDSRGVTGTSAENNSVAISTEDTNVVNKATSLTKKTEGLLNQSEMEFTCAFSNNIMEKVNQYKGTDYNSSARVAGTEQDKENLVTDNAKRKEVFLSDQSGMEFTCAFPNNILETVDKENIVTVPTRKDEVFLPEHSGMDFTCGFSNNSLGVKPKSAESNSVAVTTGYRNVVDKDITSLARKTEGLLNQSEMEFTCAFPNNIMEKVNQYKATDYNSSATVAGTEQNKENLVTGNAKKKEVFLSDQSGMEFTCAFPNNIMEKVNQYKATDYNSSATVAGTEQNKENLVTGNTKKKEVFLPDQSGMEFTCAFPVNILENVKQPERAGQDPKNAEGLNIIDKENLPILTEYEKLCLDDESDMGFTCIYPISETVNHHREPKMADSLKVDDKENLVPVSVKNVFLPDGSGIIMCGFPNSKLETDNQSKGSGSNPSSVMTGTGIVEEAENFATANTKNEKMLPNQSGIEFTCSFPDNITESNQASTMGTEGVNIADKENVFYNKKRKMALPDQINILETVNMSKGTENNSATVSVRSVNVTDKENVVSVYGKEANFSDHSKINISSTFANERSQKEARFKKPENDSIRKIKHLNTIVTHEEIENNENILSGDNTEYLPTNVNEKETFLPYQNQMPDTENHHMKAGCSSSLPAKGNNSKIEFNSKLSGKQHSASNRSLQIEDVDFKKLRIENPPTHNLEMVNQTLNENTFNLIGGDDISRGILPVMDPPRKPSWKNFKATQTKIISVESKVNAAITKPMKVREFGHIPVAVDVTNSSIDQSIIDRGKSAINTSKQDVDVKENTYTVNVGQTEKKSIQVNEETFDRRTVNVSRGDNLESQINLISFNENRENVIHETSTQSRNPANILLEKIIVPMVTRKQNPNNKQESCTRISLSENIKQKVSQVLPIPVHPPTNHEQFEVNNICEETNADENQRNNVMEERFFDSMSPSVLINNLTYSEEQEQEFLGVNLSPNETHEHRNHEVQGEKVPVTKVIYSEPMKVKPLNEEFPSMQTSSINPFNCTSITSMEDTQQLIQATFSKPFFIKTEQFDDKFQSGFLPEPDILESTGNIEPNRTITTVTTVQNDTLNAEVILKNIRKKVVRCKFQPFNYEENANIMKRHREICNKMEKLLLNYEFPQIPTFSLEEKTKKMSLGNISCDDNSNESMSGHLECGEDNKSMLLESQLSLHDKIVNVCQRSNNLLELKYFEEWSYIFSTVHECVLIYVEIHPEDGRVTEIKTTSSLDDSMDILHHFLVKNILEKLKQSTLKSYLGPYYDVLSLLDHICLTVDEVMDFCYEFLSLQKLYSTLKINADYSISMEILHNSPPIWWTVRLSMSSVTKINPETLQLESKWKQINEEHIKQILINIDDGIECLRSFISNVYKYFERTQLRYKVQQEC